MGAVNYFTSDYITMGLRPYDSWELENDSDFMEEMRRECEEYGGTIENAIADYNGTIKAIKAAIKEMRDELRTIPTWAQYNRAC